MNGLAQFLSAVVGIGASAQILMVFGATMLGIVIGMIPGLTATLGVALITTLTFSMNAETAILILICVYVGAIYGGGRAAILLNIPGTPANAASALDGFPLTRRGRASEAMTVATTGSFLGTIVGTTCLAIAAPWLAGAALSFGSYEFFWLAVFGVALSGQLSAMGNTLKGWIAGLFGLLVAMVGQESFHAYARFAFDVPELQGGFGLLAVLVGAFGCAEVLSAMRREQSATPPVRPVPVLGAVSSALRHVRTWVRSGVIGAFMGATPGVGEDMGSWASYAAARRASKNPEKYGNGSIEALLAAETGNNAAVPGALIPTLTLAIPGSAAGAVLLAAMIIHGLRPGPLIMIEQPTFFYHVVAMVFWASVAMLFIGLIMTRPLLFVLRFRREWLMGVVFVLCVVGSYAIAGRVFDVWVMVGFGVLGFLMRNTGFPVAPMVLGVVLGPILDNNLRRGLSLAEGDLLAFVSRPVSAGLAALVVAMVVLSLAKASRKASTEKNGLRNVNPTTINKADFGAGALVCALGGWTLVESLRMPRFEGRGLDVFASPGLTPAVLGAALAFMGLMLMARRTSRRVLSQEHDNAPASHKKGDAARVFFTLFMIVIYAFFMFGVMEFVAATSIFLFLFITGAELLNKNRLTPFSAINAGVLLMAPTAAFIIHFIFSNLFLVRFPS